MASQKNSEQQDDLLFSELEHLLISVISQKRDIEDKIPGGMKRIRSLKIGLNLTEKANPCFTVSLGIFEAHFNAYDGSKQKGNCYGLERVVYDWYQREQVKGTIRKIVEKELGIK